MSEGTITASGSLADEAWTSVEGFATGSQAFAALRIHNRGSQDLEYRFGTDGVASAAQTIAPGRAHKLSWPQGYTLGLSRKLQVRSTDDATACPYQVVGIGFDPDADSSGSGAVVEEEAPTTAVTLSLTLVSLTVALEAEVEDTSDLIVANLTFNQAAAITCRADLYDSDMVPAVITDAHVGVEAGGGTELTTTAQQSILFTTDADGTGALEITDVDGDLETSYWLVITPLDVLCPPKAVEIEFTEPA